MTTDERLREAHAAVTVVQCGLATAVRRRRFTKNLLDEWVRDLDAAREALREIEP